MSHENENMPRLIMGSDHGGPRKAVFVGLEECHAYEVGFPYVVNGILYQVTIVDAVSGHLLIERVP